MTTNIKVHLYSHKWNVKGGGEVKILPLKIDFVQYLQVRESYMLYFFSQLKKIILTMHLWSTNHGAAVMHTQVI